MFFYYYLIGDPSQGNGAGQGGDQDMDYGIIVSYYFICSFYGIM